MHPHNGLAAAVPAGCVRGLSTALHPRVVLEHQPGGESEATVVTHTDQGAGVGSEAVGEGLEVLLGAGVSVGAGLTGTDTSLGSDLPAAA